MTGSVSACLAWGDFVFEPSLKRSAENAEPSETPWHTYDGTPTTARCGKAELCFVHGFPVVLHALPDFRQNFTRISPEFHQMSPDFTRISSKCHQIFARISNWSTLKKGITTTQPSHTARPIFSSHPQATRGGSEGIRASRHRVSDVTGKWAKAAQLLLFM